MSPGFDLWYLASGDIIWGCSIIKVGFKHWDYKNLPTNLSINLVTDLGAEQATLCLWHCLSKKDLAYSVLKSAGTGYPNYFYNYSIIEIRLHGGVKSIFKTFYKFYGSGWNLIT